MNIGRTVLMLLLLVCSTKIAWGQQFEQEYHYTSVLTPFVVEETSTQFIIQSTSDGAAKFVDLSIDKNGNNANFQLHPYPANLPSSAFIRKSDGATLTFGRFSGDTILQYYGVNGTLAWERAFSFIGTATSISTSGTLYKGIELTDGFLFLGGMLETEANGSNKNYLFALKTDFSGNVLWQSKKEISTALSSIYGANLFGNTTYFVWQYAVANANQPFITAVDTNGIWSATTENTPGMKGVGDIAPHLAGGIVAVGYYAFASNPSAFFGKATCFDENWQVRWQKEGWPELDFITGKQNGINCFPAAIVADGDGWVMAGNIVPRNTAPGTLHKFLARLDALGNITNYKAYSTPSSGVSTLDKTSDGGFLLTYRYLLNGGNVGIIKTDSNLVAFPNLIRGKVFFDQNLSCAPDPNETVLSGWLVAITNNQDTIYTISNALGEYSFAVDTGQWMVKINVFNPYWQPCDNDIPVYLSAVNTTDTIDFALQAIVDCAQMEIDISLPFTRRCFENTLYVHYCNNGTSAAVGSEIRVVLDPSLEFVSAEIPVESIAGDTIIFHIDSVDIGECGQFAMQVYVDCDSTILGQTVCVSAYMLPDTFCIPLPFWSGAQVVVGGFCEQDSVVFWLKNTGSAPTQVLDYIIIEDMVVWRTGNFGPLQPNGSDTLRFFATGATYGLLAMQEPGYPFNAYLPYSNGPSVWVEACNWNNNMPFPGGFITKFPNEDGNPTFSTDCSVLVNAYDPNDKHANPEGLDSAHFILPGTPIEYLIRFQNTGTDTAFRVQIRDDLSPLLDPLSFHLQASSHPCTITWESGSILKCTFDNILLPDSTINPMGSHGFVQFSIQPRNSVPIGTRIENTAAIFFDFNTPIYTNTYHHTIDTLFLAHTTSDVIPVSVYSTKENLVFPNPARAGVPIHLLGCDTEALHLYDITGKCVAVLRVLERKTALPEKLPSGVYFLKDNRGWQARLIII